MARDRAHIVGKPANGQTVWPETATPPVLGKENQDAESRHDIWRCGTLLVCWPRSLAARGMRSFFVCVLGGIIDELWRGLLQAINLIIGGDQALREIVGLTFRVSGTALFFSTAIGIPLGALLGLTQFRGRRLVVALLYTGMGFPPVVIGLVVYLFLSRSGPLGQLGADWVPRLFTPAAMVAAQSIISFPLVAGFTMAAVMGIDPQVRQQVRALGATPLQTAATVLLEAKIGVMVSIIAGFGSIISEVGAVMLVGGNIEHRTRVLTTAIVLETRKGNFDLAMALGVILLSLSFLANLAMLMLQGRTNGSK